MREKVGGEPPPRAGRRRLSCTFLFFRCRERPRSPVPSSRGERETLRSLSLSLSLFSSKEALFETSARFLQLHALSRIEEK